MYKKIKLSSFFCDNILIDENGKEKKCPAYCFIGTKKEEELKKEGWMVTRDKRCYCPNCAPFYRYVGRSGKPRKYIQIKMEDLHGE